MKKLNITQFQLQHVVTCGNSINGHESQNYIFQDQFTRGGQNRLTAQPVSTEKMLT